VKIAILGATGSIGTQTLDVVRSALPHAQIEVLTGNKNIQTLAKLINEFKPKMAWVPSNNSANQLAALISVPCEIFSGERGLEICAAENDADVVVNALVGRAGLKPTMAAINASKNIALANKETLVTAGGLIMKLAREKNIRVTPIDSEHSAIWQCLQGNQENEIEKIILTASGGPFRVWDKEKIACATAKDALRHPNWNMGHKITIDSATLMNKGLELIEAMWLFNLPAEKIEVLVHPQSIIHSMVQYTDGSVMAQLGPPDMRLPILYALSAPKRIKTKFPRLNFLTCGNLTFEPPDAERFPCLSLAIRAAETGGTLPAVMNAINEWAVEQFLRGKIKFYEISDLIEQAFGTYTVKPVNSINDIIEAEMWANEFTLTR
jgi:1-deoxy-D-xylulose-5-phosphate reductoisomerase